MGHSSTNDGAGFKQDLHRMGQGVDALKTDVATVAHGALDAARHGAAELRDGAGKAVEAAKDKFNDAKDSVASGAATLKDVIAKNPVTSIGIAAGVGLLIGLVVFRPRS